MWEDNLTGESYWAVCIHSRLNTATKPTKISFLSWNNLQEDAAKSKYKKSKKNKHINKHRTIMYAYIKLGEKNMNMNNMWNNINLTVL